MLQNGIDLSTVDVSYVSSRSWYSRYSWQQVSIYIQLVLIGFEIITNYIYLLLFPLAGIFLIFSGLGVSSVLSLEKTMVSILDLLPILNIVSLL